MKQADYKGLRFGSLSQEASNEALKMGHHGMKILNQYCDSSIVERKDMNQDVKVGIAMITSYAKLRQAEGSLVSSFIQVAKMTKSGDKKLKSFVLDAIPLLAESETKDS